MLDSGYATVNANTISFSPSGDVDAIVLLQYAGADGPVHGKASSDTISRSSFGGGGVFNDNPTAFTVSQSANT